MVSQEVWGKSEGREGERVEGERGLDFRTFSRKVGKRKGQPTVLNTSTIAVVCS